MKSTDPDEELIYGGEGTSQQCARLQCVTCTGSIDIDGQCGGYCSRGVIAINVPIGRDDALIGSL